MVILIIVCYVERTLLPDSLTLSVMINTAPQSVHVMCYIQVMGREDKSKYMRYDGTMR